MTGQHGHSHAKTDGRGARSADDTSVHVRTRADERSRAPSLRGPFRCFVRPLGPLSSPASCRAWKSARRRGGRRSLARDPSLVSSLWQTMLPLGRHQKKQHNRLLLVYACCLPALERLFVHLPRPALRAGCRSLRYCAGDCSSTPGPATLRGASRCPHFLALALAAAAAVPCAFAQASLLALGPAFLA